MQFCLEGTNPLRYFAPSLASFAVRKQENKRKGRGGSRKGRKGKLHHYPARVSGIILVLEPLYSERMKEPGIEVTEPHFGDSELLDPYEKLVTIEILGRRVQVPEKNRLLRCFQYLSLNTISYGDFCWNGECTNCQVWYHEEGQSEKSDKPALSCRMEVAEGMVITKLSQFIQLVGINK